LIQKLNPSQVIADGSNYKSYIRRWKQICETNKISFHNTNNKGAFILKH
jgi:competence protein ComEC